LHFISLQLTKLRIEKIMIKIYHNPRCGKSREGLELVEKSGKAFEVVKYLTDVPSFEELQTIIKLLGIAPIELIRQKEDVWVKNFKGKELSDEAIIKIMIENPILIERPIVINGNKAVIGRPPEKILDIV
jgi:arsenate reductase (glutaredoxin)